MASGDPEWNGAAAVTVRDLCKRYDGRAVVDGVSFAIERGEIFALLGPNGAGKTTTVEILEGYRRPDGGSVVALGHEPWRAGRAFRERIGLMLQEGGIYPQARPDEALRLFASFYPAPADPDELLTLVGLAGVRAPYRRLSGGQKQRLALALALVGQPELVFLDEPTAGMDPRARHATWEIIRSLRARGVTVLLTTHFMDEAEALADRVGIMDRGKLVALGDMAALRGGDTVVRVVMEPGLEAALAALPGVCAARATAPGVYLLETDQPSLALVEVTAWAHGQGRVPRELRVGRESLEEIFLRLTGHPLGD